MNYEKDIEIIPDELDIQWIEQPRLMFKYAKLSAEASREWDQAKEKLALVRAQLDNAIRNKPSAYKLDKVTEGSVAACILQQDGYELANAELIEAQYQFNIVRAAISALENKKAALENLVKLYGQQYFSGPRIPRDINAEWQQKVSQLEADRKVKIKRREA